VGGLAEVVEDGVSGLHVQPGDVQAFGAAMTSLLENPDLRMRLGRGGRLAAEERFDAHKNVRRIVDLLGEVAAEGRS
jgi:glycosyltransferase involved in cell wall biosynthesis